ncbi:hypothetical protein DB41_KD00040 [Neochlamydia sp. TUME1]|nr:hypothetical protein DB41_KD00040 [Neochlamydia sp. TUME1]
MISTLLRIGICLPISLVNLLELSLNQGKNDCLEFKMLFYKVYNVIKD